MSEIIERSSDVRFREVSFSNVVTNSSTAVAAIPIISKRGSIHPRFFTNADEFLKEYGAPDPMVSPTIQSALNFFTEGSELWAVRTVGADALYSGLLLKRSASAELSLVAAPFQGEDFEISDLVTGTDESVLLFAPARGPGSHGDNLSIEIEGNPGSVRLIPSLVFEAENEPGLLDADTTYTYHVSPILADGERAAAVGSFTTDSVFAGSVTIRWARVNAAIGYYVYRNDGRVALVGIGAHPTTVSFTDDGSMSADMTQNPQVELSSEFQDKVFTVRVFNGGNNPVEEWDCTLLSSTNAEGVQLRCEDRINSLSSYIRVASNVAFLDTPPNITNLPRTNLAGGDSGSAPTASEVAKSLEVFGDRQTYNVTLLINGGLSDPIVQRTLDKIASSRGDCVAILDVPSERQDWDKASDFRQLSLSIDSSYSALFTSDQSQLDSVSGDQVFSPMSGWIAAACARTDRVAGVANSIAGVARGVLPTLGSRKQYDDAASDHLFRNQVNFTKTLPGVGTVIWEQQTLSKQKTAVRWLSVRRQLNTMKVACYNYLLYALQELHTDSLRRNLLNTVGAYLEGEKVLGNITHYSIVCDTSNNPTALASAGVLVFSIKYHPAIPTHEVQLEVSASSSGVNFDETVLQISSIR